MSTARVPLAGTNLSILVGILSRDPEVRRLPSGDAVVGLELTVRHEGRPAESVPVAWPMAPERAASWAAGWAAGEELLVIGRVRRRFFRAGGATQSRTEVVAKAVVPTRRAAAARRALTAAVGSIAERL